MANLTQATVEIGKQMAKHQLKSQFRDRAIDMLNAKLGAGAAAKGTALGGAAVGGAAINQNIMSDPNFMAGEVPPVFQEIANSLSPTASPAATAVSSSPVTQAASGGGGIDLSDVAEAAVEVAGIAAEIALDAAEGAFDLLSGLFGS